MLKGSSSSQSKTFHLTSKDSLIPEDSIQAILIKVEDALKNIGMIDQQVVLTVHHQHKPWNFMVVLKDTNHSQKKLKLKNVDLYVIDENAVLGEGSQGKVVLAQHIPSGMFAAAKIQKSSSPSFDYDLNIERRNLSLTERLYAYAKVLPNDEDLIKELPADYTPDQLEGARAKATIYYTLMKHVQGRNLNEFLYDIDRTQSKDSPAYFAVKRELDILSIGRLAVCAIQEVLSLHELGLAHRDIKSENYVVNTTGLLQECTALRLVDLGTALLPATERSKDDASTFGYMPPEYLVDGKDRPHWDKTCDYFQLGIVLAEILTKSNYQAGLKKLALDQAAESEKKHLSFDVIKALMPDAFAKVKKTKKKVTGDTDVSSNPPQAETEAVLKHELLYKLYILIQKLTEPDRNIRAQIDLKTLFSEFRSIHGRATTVIQLSNTHSRFQAYKLQRKNTMLDFTKIQSSSKAASSSDQGSSYASSSVSIQAPVEAESSSQKMLKRRKSAGNLQFDTIVTTVVEEAPLTERPSRSNSALASRKRTISSSPAVHKIETSSRSRSDATADLTEKMLDLSIDSEQEQVITKLMKVSERLKLLNASIASSSDQEQVVMSDFVMFSLLGKQVKHAVKEQDPDAQKRQLNRLASMTKHYQPSKNDVLNQEMATVSKVLANYPK